MAKKEIIVFYIVLVLMLVVLIVANILQKIDAGQVINAAITIILVAVTTVYVIRTAEIAKATEKQAEASMKMAEEMREQRILTSRPTIVQKANERSYDSDDFLVFNIGNGPAIELEIFLLDNKKNQKKFERHTFVIKDTENPIHFYNLSYEAYNNFKLIGKTCYLVSQYRGFDKTQIWYQTWLPFIPKKSQDEERIIVIAQELEFREVNKKESF
ncbi:MAG TPA: hypothetical protein VMW86_08425 [Dehalococcoidales bacterium]|nr:hypothetical protein [Dehalococcoidales bacterium]